VHRKQREGSDAHDHAEHGQATTADSQRDSRERRLDQHERDPEGRGRESIVIDHGADDREHGSEYLEGHDDRRRGSRTSFHEAPQHEEHEYIDSQPNGDEWVHSGPLTRLTLASR